MNTLTIVMYTVMVTVAIISGGFVFYKLRAANPGKSFEETFPDAWNKVRPILSELFVNIYNIYNADKGSFEDMLDFAVMFVKNKVDSATFLMPEEKALFTDKFIKQLLEPKLKELYEQKKK